MELKHLIYRNSTIGYYCFGSGLKQAVCFHGYGEDASIFHFLSNYAGNQYTFYSIDLPFHGRTEWNEGLNFTRQDLVLIIEKITEKAAKELTLIGFSLGGRISLSLFEAIPEKIEKIVLLAPDGLKVNFWYWLATQTWLGNRLFALTMKKPGWFFGLLKVMNLFKLVNASIFKFVNYYIGDAEVRRLLYSRWTSLRKIKPDLPVIKNLIRENKTTVRLIYGKHDRIILSSTGEQFKKGIEEYCTLTVIHSGHQVLHEKHIKEILPALMQ
ncbi:MAG: alpha/beta hydrolase [Chitinophagaceae bacterium]|nr:alpha/beta hydrolase [Chitinophagaceae bacterium]